MQVMGIENPKLAFEPVIMEAYERRMKEFMDLKLNFKKYSEIRMESVTWERTHRDLRILY